jgi:negative regulator of flagellin synthesis FlgM
VKINGSLSHIPVSDTAAQKSEAKSAAGGKGINIEASARVELSSQLKAMESDLKASPEFDAKKVDELKAAIREGRFTVNAELVADKLIQSASDFVGRTH